MSCSACSWPTTCVATPFSFDDIGFWVGTGTNRAAMVIDWVENSTEPAALAWGYRWDGTARGRDMLIAIVSADPRLFARLGGTPANPNAVYGLGYDANDDGQFGIDDGTQFDANGLAFTGISDLAESVDPEDYYAEGWFSGLWHYGLAAANPYDGGSWSSSSAGMAGRILADGSWDSWAYTPSFNFQAFAQNPVPAPLPAAHLPGDFNGDGLVDAADYVWWRKNNSISDDYEEWRANFGNSVAAGGLFASVNTGGPAVTTAPEPATWLLAIGAWCIHCYLISQLREERVS